MSAPTSPPSFPEMLESSNLGTFNGLANSSSYDAFLLDEERGRLLVGAEDHIFSFDLININRDQKQVRFRKRNTPQLRESQRQSCCLRFNCYLSFFYSLLSITTTLSPLLSSGPLSVSAQAGLSNNSITPPGLS